MDLWVKIEDFMDEQGNIQTIREYPSGHRIHLEYRLYSLRAISQEVFKDAGLIERQLQEMMYSIQKNYEERIFSRLPELTEKFKTQGQELQFYITPNAPVGAPIMVINPEDWAKKWNPILWASPIAWMFMEMRRHEALQKEMDEAKPGGFPILVKNREEEPKNHASDPQD